MASFLVKLIASNPMITARSPAILFRPVTAASCRSVSTKTFRKDDSEDDYSLLLHGKCTSTARSIFNDAVCPRLSATSNLARLLNVMEKYNYFVSPRGGCPRWDVMEDHEALYLLRDMSGEKHSIDFTPCSGQMCVYGGIRVDCNPGEIEVTAVTDCPEPELTKYVGYFCKIYLPPNLYKEDVEIGVLEKNQVLKITIPKEKDKWIKNITINSGLLV